MGATVYPCVKRSTARTPIPILGRVRRAELLSLGTHRGLAYTAEDFRDMVRNFRQFCYGPDALFRVPLKIGHEEYQPLIQGLDPVDATGMQWLDNTGVPKLGIISSLWFDGRFLCGEFSEVPEWLVYLINQRAYDVVSSEVYKSPPEGVPAKGRMLRAVALLGGEIPQVKNISRLPMAEFYQYTERSRRFRPVSRMVSRSRPSPAGGLWLTYSEVIRMDRDEMIAQLEKMGANREILERLDDNSLGEWLRMVQESGGNQEPDGDEGALGGAGAGGGVGGAPAGPEGVAGDPMGDPAAGGEGSGSLFEETAGGMGGSAEGAPAGEGEMGEEEVAKMPKEQGMQALRERVTRYSDKAKRYNDMGKKCYGEDWEKAGKKPAVMASGSSEGVQNFSEKKLSELVEKVVRNVLNPLKSNVVKLSEETKKSRVDEVLRAYADRIHPYEVDSTSNLPTLRDDLLRLDAVAPVMKYSENGEDRSLTAFDVAIEKIKSRPTIKYLRKERIASDKVDPHSGVVVYSEGRKSGDDHLIDMYCEKHSDELEALHMTKAEFRAAYQTGDANLRRMVKESVG